MADFKTHITTSSVLGIVYGSAGYYLYDISLPHSLVAGTLCGIAGMLPDLDSDSGVPLREMLSFVSVLIPMLMLRRFTQLGLSPETMVFVAGVLYVGIRFGIGAFFRKFTKHRGMWHSIPAALIAGLLTFFLCMSPEIGIRIFKSWAVVLGFLSHLVLDEIYSVDLNGRKIRIKKSSGTAMKFFGDNMLANLFAYTCLGVLCFFVFKDQSIMNRLGETKYGDNITKIEAVIEKTSQRLNDVR